MPRERRRRRAPCRVPLGIWAGWRLHNRLDQAQMYRACYALLVVTAIKLLWDGVSGLGR